MCACHRSCTRGTTHSAVTSAVCTQEGDDNRDRLRAARGACGCLCKQTRGGAGRARCRPDMPHATAEAASGIPRPHRAFELDDGPRFRSGRPAVTPCLIAPRPLPSTRVSVGCWTTPIQLPSTCR
eukprot:4994965-Prymnesium_polylepis.2